MPSVIGSMRLNGTVAKCSAPLCGAVRMGLVFYSKQHPSPKYCVNRESACDRTVDTLIHYRLERAQESLDEARLLADAGRWNTCVNRLYYSCFYAVCTARP